MPSVIGTTFNNIHTTNAMGDSVDGTIEVDVGSLSLQGGGTFTSMAPAPLTLAAGTSLDFQGGTFSVTAPLKVFGAGRARARQLRRRHRQLHRHERGLLGATTRRSPAAPSTTRPRRPP